MRWKKRWFKMAHHVWWRMDKHSKPIILGSTVSYVSMTQSKDWSPNSRRWAFHKWQDCTHSYWISWRRRASDKAVVRQLHCEQIKKDHYFLNNNPMFSKHCTSHFFLTSDLYLVFQPWELTSVNTVKFTSLSYLQLNLSFVNSPFPWSNVHK